MLIVSTATLALSIFAGQLAPPDIPAALAPPRDSRIATDVAMTEQLAVLLSRIEALESRVLALEAENASLKERLGVGTPVETPSQRLDASDARLLQIVEVRKRQPNRTAAEQIRRLNAEADAAAAKARELIRKREQERGGASSRGLGPEITAQQTRAKDLRAEASRLQREYDAPGYLLCGWDGRRAVVLLMSDSQAHGVRSARIGDAVEWRGKLHSGAGEAECFEVSSVRRVDTSLNIPKPPADFVCDDCS